MTSSREWASAAEQAGGCESLCVALAPAQPFRGAKLLGFVAFARRARS